MTPEIYISVFGALTAISVSIVGAIFANKNNIVLQTRKLKEAHYVSYIEALHDLASDSRKTDFVKRYTFARDKLFLIASEEVIIKMLEFEELAVGKENALHDQYLTELVKAIRKDLKIIDRNFPKIYLKRG